MLRIVSIAGGGTCAEDIIEDRYYQQDEYKSLTKGPKNYLRNLRRKRKGKEGDIPKAKGNGEGGDTSSESKISALTAQIATLEAEIASLEPGEVEVDDSEPEEQADDSNRNHPALTCQKKRVKKS